LAEEFFFRTVTDPEDAGEFNFSYRREWKDRKGKGYALRAMQQARVIKAIIIIIIINLQMSSLVE